MGHPLPERGCREPLCGTAPAESPRRFAGPENCGHRDDQGRIAVVRQPARFPKGTGIARGELAARVNSPALADLSLRSDHQPYFFILVPLTACAAPSLEAPMALDRIPGASCSLSSLVEVVAQADER